MTDIAARLEALEDRQAIEQVLYRYCRAMDRSDLELFRTVFWDDGGFGPGAPSAVACDFSEPLIAAMQLKYQATHHMIGNILIDLQGDAASVESYATVYHKSFPTPESNEAVLGKAWMQDGQIDQHASHDLVIGVRYIDRFEKRFGAWRIAVRSLIFDWSQAQPSNIRNFGAFNTSTLLGRRGRDDVSYR